MITLKLNRPVLIGKKYQVFFDQDNKFLFSSKREAEDFIRSICHHTDEAVLMITEELNKLSEIYRLFYLADNDFKFKFEIQNSLDLINNRLAWIASRSGSVNHNAIFFTSIITCFNELIQAFFILSRKAAARKDTITKRRCELKQNLLQLFLDNYLSQVKISSNTNHLKLKAV